MNIVNFMEESDGDWHRLKTYKRLLRALGLMAEDCGTSATKRRSEEDGDHRRRVRHKSNFSEYDKVVYKYIVLLVVHYDRH